MPKGKRIGSAFLVYYAQPFAPDCCSTGKNQLPDIMRDFKKFTSRHIIEEINANNESRKEGLLKEIEMAGRHLKRVRHYKVWQDGNHPIELDTNEMMEQRLAYTHDNTVESGMVYRAIDYCGGVGLLETEKID